VDGFESDRFIKPHHAAAVVSGGWKAILLSARPGESGASHQGRRFCLPGPAAETIKLIDFIVDLCLFIW